MGYVIVHLALDSGSRLNLPSFLNWNRPHGTIRSSTERNLIYPASTLLSMSTLSDVVVMTPPTSNAMIHGQYQILTCKRRPAASFTTGRLSLGLVSRRRWNPFADGMAISPPICEQGGHPQVKEVTMYHFSNLANWSPTTSIDDWWVPGPTLVNFWHSCVYHSPRVTYS